jgi:hypothetical protein
MAEGLMRAAINKLEIKYIPQPINPQVFVPQEQYRSFFPLLEIFGSLVDDKDTQEKVKYIYDKMIALNKLAPHDELMRILSEIGETKWNESKLDKIYKYLNLSHEAEKALKYYDLIKGEIETLKAPSGQIKEQ